MRLNAFLARHRARWFRLTSCSSVSSERRTLPNPQHRRSEETPLQGRVISRLGGWFACLLGFLTFAETQASPPALGFLTLENSPTQLGVEARAAYELARKLSAAELILTTAEGDFRDPQNQPVPLDRFQVLWYHQGDSTNAVIAARSLEALRAYVSAGKGLYLSGAALGWVHALGVESARPRLITSATPVTRPLLFHTREPSHPIFRNVTVLGLPWEESVGGFPRELDVPMTERGLAVYADFVGSGGPRQGKVLGYVAEAGANPLVEYTVGQGRIIALGGPFGAYAAAPSSQTNLHRFTASLLAYLGDSRQWPKQLPPPKPVLGIPESQWLALERALDDLVVTYGERYPGGQAYRERLRSFKAAQDHLLRSADPSSAQVKAEIQQLSSQFQALKSEALLANPLLQFGRLLLIQRGVKQLGLPANYNANTESPMTGYDNQLVTLSPIRPDGQLTTLFKPEGGRFVGDVDLHFQGDRMLFSMPGANGRWQVFELEIAGMALKELPLIQQPDVDNYDACYLPDGRIMFTSTAPFIGVPCVNGSSHVANMYLLGRDGSIRQLTMDQEHNWCPTVANNGRVMYLRWEYTDLPHANSRILFDMNPDGTEQRAIYGSSSFFPPSFFYARPVPGHPSKIVGVATGHHGVSRSGRLLLLDLARGSREADGVVQEIPGYGKKVEPIIRDTLADGVWPQFLHPYPLSEKHYLVSARPSPQSHWGIYLADIYDNLVLIKEVPQYALFEPIPLQPTPPPPIIPDKVNLQRTDAVVYLNDIYAGGGLQGIPPGTVKKLRLITYHYAYRGMGGLLGAVGLDGPWDVKRVLGTVPVESDGSAFFKVPANTPIAVQPLDEKGQAMQIMRSWFTAMPGEVLSCVGCHEQLRTVPSNHYNLASRREPSAIQPWYGPTRGFAFSREVQPVLDHYCVACHNGQTRPDGTVLGNLRGDQRLTNWWSGFAGNVGPTDGGKFSVAYAELHRFVRHPGIESDIHMLSPMEYHAETTELVQLLRKGHYQVQLDPESWDRLITWIDLNTPYHGTWTEVVGEKRVKTMAARRREMSRLYANVDEDPESIPACSPDLSGSERRAFPNHQQRRSDETPLQRHEISKRDAGEVDDGHPSSPISMCETGQTSITQCNSTQSEALPEKQINLGNGLVLNLVLIPAGEFVMGDLNGHPDERPITRVSITKPFWLSRTEISNEQFAQFDPHHDSHFEPMHAYQFGIHGFPVNKPQQPVVRVSWRQALDFCQWLSEKTRKRFNLPTEAQWEYACRSGTGTPFWYGQGDTDFTPFANLGDAKLRDFTLETYITVRPIANPSPFDDWVPKDDRFNDGHFVAAPGGQYRPNPWGLHDMHGNVWEWTRSTLKSYPYREDDGRNLLSSTGAKVVRGGSWYDRPQRCRSAFRLAYRPYQKVFNVGFRVMMEADSL